VVFPHAVDLEESQRGAFVADVEFLHDAVAVVVARHDADFDAMQIEFVERVAQHHRHRLGDVTVAGSCLVDPVADGSALQRTTNDVVEVHLSGEGVVDEESECITDPGLTIALLQVAT